MATAGPPDNRKLGCSSPCVENTTSTAEVIIPSVHPQVDDNMRRAHKRDAATNRKFFFRSNIAFERPPPPPGGRCVPGSTYRPCADEPQNALEEMNILEMLEGKVRPWIQDDMAR